MSKPSEGQPYDVTTSIGLTVGQFAAAPGTDAYKSVIIIDNDGNPTSNVVDEGVPFSLTAYFLQEQGFLFNWGGTAFDVDFHIRGLDGANVLGSPFNVSPVVAPDIPAGAAPVAFGHVDSWASATILIPATTLTAGESYRVTVEGKDAAMGLFAVHDETIVYAH